MLLCVRRGLGLAQVLLLGVALSAVLGAFSGLLSKGMLHDVSRTSRLFYWGMGDLASVSMGACLFLLVCLLLHLVLAGALFRRLDLLGVGMRYAQSHGVSLGILQTHVLLLVALSVGSVVAIAGSISFVGLMVPHIARVFFGNLSKHLFWGSSLIGGLLLLLVDLACRTALPGEELPLGVLTAILGGAFFFVILLRSKSWGSSHV
jgi:iron complex transport system permease protein